MKKTERIEALVRLGNAVAAMLEEMESGGELTGNPLNNIVQQAYRKNPWFIPANTISALSQWTKLLEKRSLEKWTSAYKLHDSESISVKNVGIIMAGNIPMVGFHDLICVLLSGHKAIVKCSADDEVLIPFLLEVLLQVAPEMSNYFKLEKRFGDIDAVIATGSNNTSRYFDYYFGKYPHVIRKNRNSVAVLTGSETETDLRNLGEDIFSYFGLGCRNVSKLYVPENYQFDGFFRAIEIYGEALMQHNKYMNNFDYHNALFMLNNEKFLTNNFLLLREHQALATPVSVLHYEVYSSKYELMKKLEAEKELMQCIIGKAYLPFGTSQQPGLSDYADGVDTMKFLLSI
ncbi:MAG: acyl-CoA reductase [Bacteroidetes bacterium]|nr:acyl-CoA reductase [Bacteroidota bacterium]